MTETEWVTGKVVLNVGGVPLDLEMTVPSRPVKPHRMLPIFQKMADSFSAIGVDAEKALGNSVSCGAGCTACCHQAVPVSEAEVYYYAELVASMPEPKRTEVKRRFADSLKHFRESGWFSKLRSQKAHSLKGAEELVLEYFREQVPCPFLEDSMCMVYEHRPLACREYLVTSPAENCWKPTPKDVRTVGLPVKPSSSLKQLTNGEAQSEGFLILTMALELAEKHRENFPQRTGEQWMAEFFGRLAEKEGASHNKTVSQKNLRKKRKPRHAKR